MRRLAAAAALVLCSVAPAGAHPGHGAESVTVDGDALRYSPDAVTVGVGESVVWFWHGVVTRNHSVTSDPGQLESFDSDPDSPPTNDSHPDGDYFAHAFRNAGRFTYHCKVHPQMTGVVEVVQLPGTTSRPLRLSGLQVSVQGESVAARFRLSVQADLAGRIAELQNGHWRDVKTFNHGGRRGKNELDVPSKSLGPGRYRLSLTAYDSLNRRAKDVAPFAIGG
jgi:plastocyanin